MSWLNIISAYPLYSRKAAKENGYVPIVILTHEATEQNLKNAKAALDRLAVIKGESVSIRIEEGRL